MKELVEYIVKELVDDASQVKITVEDTVINISVAKPDVGKVIGRQGKSIKAIRSIVKSVSVKNNTKYTVEVLEPDGAETKAE